MSFAKRFKPEDEATDLTSHSVPLSEDKDSHTEHHNQPIKMVVYFDPEMESKKLMVIVAFPSESTKVNFSPVGTGRGPNMARFTYNWPEVLYNIDKILQKGKKMESYEIATR